MKRREFVGAATAAALTVPLSRLRARVGPSAQWILVPMDERQTNHLKAYGLAYRALTAGVTGEWLLNYRGGSFLFPSVSSVQRDALLAGISTEIIDDVALVDVRGTIASNNMDSVPLEKAPDIAVYAPPDAVPWDDAVRIVLEYAGIDYTQVWDPEVVAGDLPDYDWLHLHHEDFTGQYSKFFLSYSGSQWLADMVRINQRVARDLNFQSVPHLKKAVANGIRDYVEGGGFLFAMCTATETLEIAMAAENVDIAAQYADGTPMDPNASSKLDWSRTFAFDNVELELSPATASFSDIDGHQVNNPPKRQSLGASGLFDFSAKIDVVPTMLVQNHRSVISDFYGLTTSFHRDKLKPGVTVLASEEGAPWAKYIHGSFGEGTWTFLGGHDPEDPQHRIGDPPSDLDLYTDSPGYRLILNNVLFPAAKKRELKT